MYTASRKSMINNSLAPSTDSPDHINNKSKPIENDQYGWLNEQDHFKQDVNNIKLVSQLNSN